MADPADVGPLKFICLIEFYCMQGFQYKAEGGGGGKEGFILICLSYCERTQDFQI